MAVLVLKVLVFSLVLTDVLAASTDWPFNLEAKEGFSAKEKIILNVNDFHRNPGIFVSVRR